MPTLPVYDAHEIADPGQIAPVQIDKSVAEAEGRTGGAIASIGNAVEGLAEHFQKREEQKQNFAASIGLQSLHENIIASDAKAANQMPVDGNGWAAARQTNSQAAVSAYVQSLPENLRETYGAKAGLLALKQRDLYAQQEVAQQGQYYTGVVTQQNQKQANGLYANPSVQTWETARDNLNHQIDNMPVPPEQKEALRVKLQQDLALASVTGSAKAPAMEAAQAKVGVIGPGGTYASPPQGQLPAGMRNNNPGNIKYTGTGGAIIGPSSNTDQGDPQAVFRTQQDGMDAAANLMLRKFNGGKTTINALVAEQGGWTPGNYEAAKNIAAAAGVAPDQPLDIGRNPGQFQSVLRGLISQEHGPASKAYPDEMIGSSVARATGQKADGVDMPRIQNASISGNAINSDSIGKVNFNGSAASVNGKTFTSAASPVDIARQFSGMDEVTHRDAISAFISKSCGQKVDPSRIPWCASFVDGVLGASGRQTTGSARAADFLNYGAATTNPTQGDVVVLSSNAPGRSGHVGFVIGIEGDKVRYIAGNDNNKVEENTAPVSKVMGFRHPPEPGSAPMDVSSFAQGHGPGGHFGLDPNDPRLSAIPWQQRRAVEFDAMNSAERLQTQQNSMMQQQHADFMNTTQLAANDGKYGLADLDRDRQRGAITQYGDVSKLQSIIASKQENNDALSEFSMKLADPKAVFNPLDKDDMKAVDAGYAALTKGGVNPADAAQRVIERTGIVPSETTTALRGAMVSGDADRAQGALTATANILRVNPNILDTLPGGEKLAKQANTFNHYTNDMGMTAQAATQKIVEAETPEYQRKVSLALKDQDIGQVVKQNLSVGDLESSFNTGLPYFGRPSVGAALPKVQQALMGDYEDWFKIHYQESGDVNQAKALAQADLKKVWGPTSVTGTQVFTRYPIEQAPAYAGVPDIGDKVAASAIAAIKDGSGQDVTRDKLMLVPSPDTPDAWKAGKAPPMVLQWMDANGHMQMAPKPFTADPGILRFKQSLDRQQQFEDTRAARMQMNEGRVQRMQEDDGR